MMDFHLVWRWITESGNPVGMNHFPMGFACFPILWNPRFVFPFGLPLSSCHTSFRQIVHSCIIKGGPTH